MSVSDSLRALFASGNVTLAAIRDLLAGDTSGNNMATVSNWNACLGEGVVLSCTVTANNDDNGIVSAGLLLATTSGKTLGACYASGFLGDSVDPTLTVYGSGLAAGDQVVGSIVCILQGGQSFDPGGETLTIGSCSS